MKFSYEKMIEFIKDATDRQIERSKRCHPSAGIRLMNEWIEYLKIYPEEVKKLQTQKRNLELL